MDIHRFSVDESGGLGSEERDDDAQVFGPAPRAGRGNLQWHAYSVAANVRWSQGDGLNGVFGLVRLRWKSPASKLRSMKIHVLIAGIADPKWPLPSVIDAGVLKEHSNRHATLSPFDEAALELALKLRESDPVHTLHAIVAGPEALARKVAEWRLDSVLRLAAGSAEAWDSARSAISLADAMKAQCDSTLVLVGREFGDFDDGALSAMLAHNLGVPHFPLTTDLALRDGVLWGTRQHAGRMERYRVPERAVLSVTNDPLNRLRHPLLKNVMAARRLDVPAIEAGESAATVGLLGLEPARATQRSSACRMLAGSVAEQCSALAQVLLQEGADA